MLTPPTFELNIATATTFQIALYSDFTALYRWIHRHTRLETTHSKTCKTVTVGGAVG